MSPLMSVCRSSLFFQELGNPHVPGPWLEYFGTTSPEVIVGKRYATLETEVIVGARCYNWGNRGHCWLTTVIWDYLITTAALDNMDAFIIPFEYE